MSSHEDPRIYTADEWRKAVSRALLATIQEVRPDVRHIDLNPLIQMADAKPNCQRSAHQRHLRNLNPTPEARVAMIVWGREYSEQRGGSMDFWDGLGAARQNICKAVVRDMREHATKETP